MAGGRLRSVGGSVALTLLGVAALAGTLPKVALASTLPACITESSGAAWLGVHLSLLRMDPTCPDGMFAPGVHYAEIARFSVMLSLSALVAGVITLLGGLGFGIWARVAVRRARAWIHHRLALPVVGGLAHPHVHPVLSGAPARFHDTLWASRQLLRGPPVPVLA